MYGLLFSNKKELTCCNDLAASLNLLSLKSECQKLTYCIAATCRTSGLIYLRGGDGRMEKNTETVHTKAGARWVPGLCSDTVTPSQTQHVYYTLLKGEEGVRVFSGLEPCLQQ